MATSTRTRVKRPAATVQNPREAREGAASAPLSRALAELYAATLDAFVARRRELVRELRAAGELAASRFVAGVSRPTRTAWALNQVARADPQSLRAVFDARDAATAAQKRGELEPLQAATRTYRERVSEVVRAARDALRKAGVGSTTSQARADARRIGETLQAAHADEDARERLLAGRLARDIQVEDPFAGLEISAPPTGPGPRHGARPAPAVTRAPAARATDDRELERQRAVEARREQQELEREREKKRRAAIEAARKQVASLEEAARVARSAAEKSRFAAQRAQAEAERAKRAATEADDRLAHAREELRALDR